MPESGQGQETIERDDEEISKGQGPDQDILAGQDAHRRLRRIRYDFSIREGLMGAISRRIIVIDEDFEIVHQL